MADATVAALGDAFEYREIIEAHAVRQFALHASKAVIETLERATQEVLSKASGEISRTLQEKAVEVDWRMHDQIVDSLGNQPVSRDYRVNSARIRLMRASNRLIPERLVSAMNEHLAILRACKKRDPEAAAASLRIHLAVARQRALDHR